MFHLDDIRSLSDFQRNAKEHIERLKETGRPEVLTVNGTAAVVVQDAQSYQKLMELLERAEAIEGIRRGVEDANEGRTKPARKAYKSPTITLQFIPESSCWGSPALRPMSKSPRTIISTPSGRKSWPLWTRPST